MKYSIFSAQLLTIGLLTFVTFPATAQQAYPNKAIRIVVPYPPGGANNILARLIGEKLTENWRQPVIVDNRPGGNSIIGTDFVAKSAPDGYSIAFSSTSTFIVPLLLPFAPYDSLKDFSPISTIASTEYVLVAHPSVPADTVRELIALAKSKPGQLNYASGGSGSVPHLAGELLNLNAGIKMQHIPYKGGGPLMVDLIGGQVQVAFQPPIVIPQVKAGKLKALATSGTTRSSSIPHVPTFAEAGLENFRVNQWYGLLAPAGTPSPVINKISTETSRILASANTKTELASQGMEPFISTPEQFYELMKADTAKFSKVIKAANITPE